MRIRLRFPTWVFLVIITIGAFAPLESHALSPYVGVIKGSHSTLYYLGKDYQRYVFPNEATYRSWYPDFSRVSPQPDSLLATIPIGGNVTYRPGVRLVKVTTDPRVYAVDRGGVLRWVETESVARVLYGPDWNRNVDDIPDAFFVNYALGASIRIASDFSPTAAAAASPDIDADRAVRSGPAATLAPPNTPTGAPSATGMSDATRVIPARTLPATALGARNTDALYGTTIRRITDRVATGGFGTHAYSQLQAFSSDNQFVLLNEDSEFVVRRMDALARTAINLANTNAPRWQPAQSHTLVFYDTNEDANLRVQYGNTDTGTVRTAYTFPAPYERIRVNQSFDELSRDGRWMAGMASTSDNDQMVFALDLTAGTLGAQVRLRDLYTRACTSDPQYGVLEPDWVGVSPLGRYLVVQWARDGGTRCSGLETFDIRTGVFVGRVYDGHQHGDLGVDRDGTTEFFMTFEMVHPSDNGRPSQGMRILPGPATGSATPRYLQVMDWGNQSHLSCQGPNGVCLVTSGSDTRNGRSAFEGELWLQYTDGRVLRLAQHGSTECGYWVQPRASMSRDGRYVIFASDAGVARCASDNENLGRGEAYVVELPSGLAAAGPSSTANPAAITP